jgi:hypothetical protein
MSFKGSMGWSMATACAVYAIAGLASCVVMDSNVPGTHLNFRDDLIIANLEVSSQSTSCFLSHSIFLKSAGLFLSYITLSTINILVLYYV